MSDAERTPGIVLPPRVDDGNGYSRVAKCCLCNRPLLEGTIMWYSLPSDPDGLRRCVHAFCAHEYSKFLRAVGYSL